MATYTHLGLLTWALAILTTPILAATTPPDPLPIHHALSQCQNNPAGRLLDSGTDFLHCPLPGHLGFLPDDDDDLDNLSDSQTPSSKLAIQWTYPPHCITGTLNTTNSTTDDTIPPIHCLFTLNPFRPSFPYSQLSHDNNKGISLITSPTLTSEILSHGGLSDSPGPLTVPSRRLSQTLSTTPPWKVVPVKGKGMGLTATRRIKRGEILMADTPVLLMGTEFLRDVKQAHHRRRVIRRAIGQLPEGTKTKVWGLQGGDVDGILGANANSVVVGDQVCVGLFLDAARINHSCKPNAYFRFSQRRLTMEVLAFRTISPGEEITMSYVPLATNHTDRRNYLLENWGFECTCPLCNPALTSPQEIEESQVRRERMVELKQTIAQARREGFYKDAVTITRDWLQFAEWEDLPPHETEFHDTLADLYFLEGDLVNATRYARMAFDGWVRMGSVDDEGVERARGMLKGVGEWARRESETRGGFGGRKGQMDV